MAENDLIFGANPSIDYEKGTGCDASPYDPRTVLVEFPVLGVEPSILVKGGKPYVSNDILDQYKVGICTAISLIQNRNKVNGKKYSADFQYLLQKKYVDGDWEEGSSALSALKVGKNLGFLPENLWTHTKEIDRKLSYANYVAKLEDIPDAEVLRLIGLCVDKIPGYGMVDVRDRQAIALSINTSEAGLIVRYDSGNSWYTDKNGKFSWLAKDINPIREPKPATSGHLIINNEFDYSNTLTQHSNLNHVNTWGTLWCNEGQCNIIWDEYRMTEGWLITRTPPVIPPLPTYTYTKLLKLGMRGWEVKTLQEALNKKGYILKTDSIFGKLTQAAVFNFQSKNGLVVDGLFGPKSGAVLQKMI